MSNENVELVKRLLIAHNRGDLGAVLADCDPAIEIDWSRSIGPEAGIYHGHDGLSRLWRTYREVFDEVVFEAREFIDAGEQVVVPQVGKVRHREGITASVPSVFVFTIKNGQVVRIRVFNSRAEALTALR